MPLDPLVAQQRLQEFSRGARPNPDDVRKFFTLTLGARFPEGGLSNDYELATPIGKAYREVGMIRRAVFMKAIQGKLGPSLSKALDSVERFPFQVGYSRAPFRLPKGDPILDRTVGLILIQAFRLNRQYDQNPAFLAEWCGYIDPMGFLYHTDAFLAAAIDAGDRTVLNTLLQTLNGTHPIGAISRTGIRALLRSERPDAWEAVESLLLKAQREEGLRQTIFESVDELHPRAFPRFVRLVVEHDLLRFSSVSRAFLIWLPGLWLESQPKSGARVLGRLLEFLGDPRLMPDAAKGDDVYLRLWATAFENVHLALEQAKLYLFSPEASVRRMTTFFAGQAGLTSALPLLETALRDPDIAVASTAVAPLRAYGTEQLAAHGLAATVLEVAEGWSTPKESPHPKRTEIWDLALYAHAKSQAGVFAGRAHELSPTGRMHLAMRLPDIPDAKLRRDMAMGLFSDTSPDVRRAAFDSLTKEAIDSDEAMFFEDLLRRKASDLRHASLRLLSKQPDKAALASGERLLTSKDRMQRLGGLELLVELAEANVEAAKRRVLAYAESQPKLDELETSLVNRVRGEDQAEKPTLENGFGLYRLDQILFAPRPPRTEVSPFSLAGGAILRSLDNLVHAHRNEEVTFPGWDYTSAEEPKPFTATLGDLTEWSISNRVTGTYATNRERFTLAALLADWDGARLPEARDGDGQELLRAYLMVTALPRREEAAKGDIRAVQKLVGAELRYPLVIAALLKWAMRMNTERGRPDVLLDILSDRIATTADDQFIRDYDSWVGGEKSWRTDALLMQVVELYTELLRMCPELGTPEEDARAFRILRYVDEPYGLAGRAEVDRLARELLETNGVTYVPAEDRKNVPKTWKTPHRRTCPVIVLDRAFRAGGCTRFDVLDQFGHYNFYQRERTLTVALRRGKTSTELMALAEEYVARLVEIESTRGELPTAASAILRFAKSGIYLPQVRLLLSANAALSARAAGATSRTAVFNDLFAVSKPRPFETPEICAAAFREEKIRPERLLELAMHAPQWASTVELAIGWEGLADAVWWVHAHTKDEQWGIEEEIKAIWSGETSERTPLSSESLLQGAVDVAWFRRFRSQFDAKRWKQIENVSKFASSGNGHGRAKLFAQAMTGEVTVAELLSRIESKRNADSVRALGLVPLGEDRDRDMRERYDVIQEFLRGSRQFGAMRQASEKLAVSIALENLARTAGYPDPLRLTWALESRDVEDLHGGGKKVAVGECVLRLHFDANGDPQIETSKAGLPLKDIPSAIKKDPDVKVLTDRRAALRKQAQRMRTALEQAMQRGDAFEARELHRLMAHPGLAPMLRNLVFVGASGAAGFLDETGTLKGETKSLIIAHPHDLLARGDWADWQHVVVSEERVQPFKQVFRELYVLTESERAAEVSTRYAGHQVHPRQTLAILGKRDWVFRAEEGVSKTLHGQGMTARLEFAEYFYTPAEVEGLTIENLSFTRSGDWKPIPLADVPPKVFSETMRDLDLIVSVASMVGIDPEASESTIEMRANVVRELTLLSRLGNVSLTENHAIVAGKLGEYSIHLGSGVVHQRTRGELVILPVRQPQRGRLFLPFLDDDPRTAEVVSKVVLLARDSEIKDPTILSQIVQVK